MPPRPPQPKKQSTKYQGPINLNDDEAEKRRRRSSTRNAADSRRESMAAAARDSFRQPQSSPESAVPLMANFEEWMKLVKDNKINPSNSWNFALIDYFHDMAVLKEGDGGINFQKASYTLDGCVKIYTSRVDSAASETGKLLSGLADSGKELKKGTDGSDIHENSDDDENQETGKRRHARRKNRSDATLASSFDQIQVKNLELELAVDPLFRKMCADFNEGGTKGLLLNNLGIDNSGRVVFDGQVDQQPGETNTQGEEDREIRAKHPIESINLSSIRETFLPGLVDVEHLTICPSLPMLMTALKDPSVTTPEFIKDMENIRIEDEGAFAGDIGDFDNDDGGADLELMAEQDESHLEFGVLPNQGLDQSNSSVLDDPGSQGSGIMATTHNAGQEANIMAYFDETLRKNWAGPEHWKVQKIKGQTIPKSTGDEGAAPKKRVEKQKEPFFIDFLSPDGEVNEDTLFADGGSSINIPKSQHKCKTRNLLPNDEHFSSQSLIKLFLKPQAQFFHKYLRLSLEIPAENDSPDINVDENFFAENYLGADHQSSEQRGDYDADFFHNGDDGMNPGFEEDDYDGGVPFSSSQEPDATSGGLLGNKVARPEYINYAKAAKRVNIKLLKDNIWNTLDINPTESRPKQTIQSDEFPDNDLAGPIEERKFTDMVQDLKNVYPPQQLSEISTSFCFICLLHLANERGLVIEDNLDNTELTIRKDTTVSLAELSA